MDVDAVLLSLQERDKWRRRLDTLQRSVEDVRTKRLRLRARLRTIRRDIGRLATLSDALLDQTRRTSLRATGHGANENHLPPR